jgi:hypothetical protein
MLACADRGRVIAESAAQIAQVVEERKRIGLGGKGLGKI